MNYFNIEPITVNVSPFETKQAIAIQWTVLRLERNSVSAICVCSLLKSPQAPPIYTWHIDIPKSILDQWLDDSVIDNYICSTDPRFVKVIEN